LKQLISMLLGLATVQALSAPPTIVAFGDSTTAVRGKTEVYATLLANELSYDGGDVKVINSGIGGNTTKNAKSRFEKDVLEHQPDVVIIQFGINDSTVDVWRKPPATAPRVALEDYRKNIVEMVHTLKQRGARVVLMSPNPISWTPPLLKLYSSAPYLPNDADGMNVLLRDYAEAVRTIAREESVGLVDVYAAFKKADLDPKHKPGWLCADGMHPDDAGHRTVSGLLIEHLTTADKHFTRKPHTVWTPSGDVNEINPHATEITHDAPGPAVLGPSLIKLADGAVMSVYSTPTSYAGKPGHDSSHSPAHVIRLSDGRLAMAWNPAVHQRRQLHLSLSEDEGHTWSPSFAAVRGSATYPYILEAKPGELWVGYMDAHSGWGTDPRARHFKVDEQVLLDQAKAK
jgi:lysophospholipase L1-like esterase